MPAGRVAPEIPTPVRPTYRSSGCAIDPSRIAAARRAINEQGLTTKQWAERHGFTVRIVYRVLEGNVAAIRGEAHRIAVALGLKDAGGPVVTARLAPMVDQVPGDRFHA